MTLQDLQNLWPNFAEPGPPSSEYLAQVDEFARNLKARTGNLVEARLEPVRFPDVPLGRAYHFRIAETVPRGESKVIFTGIEQDGVLIIKGWSKKDRRLRTYAEVEAFLHECATSDRVDALVRRLMLIAQARARPASGG